MMTDNNSYTFFPLFLLVVSFVLSKSINGFSLTAREPVKLSEDKRSIISPDEIFELGLFKATRLSGIDGWYLGIWYKRLPATVVWIANRDHPLSNSTATLKISNTNLFLDDEQSGPPVWKTNLINHINEEPLVAELLDNGNFVLRYSNRKSFLWQSFDYPTDTLLPGMKLGWDRTKNLNKTLTSWASLYDPSSGNYDFEIENWKVSHGLITNTGQPEFRTDLSYSNLVNIAETEEEISHSLNITTNVSSISILQLTSAGALRLTELIGGEKRTLFYFPNDRCDYYNSCGENSYCNTSNNCECMAGFQWGGQYAWGLTKSRQICVRKSQLSCHEKEFKKIRNMKLPDTEYAIVDIKVGLEECEKRCLKNCNCTAFAITDMGNGGSGCVMWTGDLIDLRSYMTEGQDLYVKLPADDLGGKRNINIKPIIGSIIGGLGLLGLVILCYWLVITRNRSKSNSPSITEPPSSDSSKVFEDWGSICMDYDVIATATENFSDSNTLGKGGHGTVYKGQLPDGHKIAVKKMTADSKGGLTGLGNEINLIAKVQHSNLIRLLGSCSTSRPDHNLLVYEYVENSSLDTYIFDTTGQYVLNWEKRFEIIKGIVRGLIYLHQDSRFRIIHLDLKPNNILLDKKMIPKISDFGLAQTLEGNATIGFARTAVGTFGYIAPELRNDNVYSVKSDVYSFGVMLLEIVSGKKNMEFIKNFDGTSLLRIIWDSWSKGEVLEIVDPVLKDSSLSSLQEEEIRRCVQIGLLCVHESPEDRPTMTLVLSLLGKEVDFIDRPKPPAETEWTGIKGEASTSTAPPIGSTMGAR
uniref:Receptor-like serine/threonine-protein kinase n=3 Tax=Leavenworthia alabamica TaxID=310722 RepID=R9S9P4_LEAAL|nr:Lal2 S-domain receptor kinase [Leavenworthia alabamica]